MYVKPFYLIECPLKEREGEDFIFGQGSMVTHYVIIPELFVDICQSAHHMYSHLLGGEKGEKGGGEDRKRERRVRIRGKGEIEKTRSYKNHI